jgi:fido (protein-threonine AMPylation protein)
MELPADLLHLFEHLRAGRARRSAAAWAQAGRLDAWLPVIGPDTAPIGLRRRAAWLLALDEWHYRQGPLSVALLLASRVWRADGPGEVGRAFPCVAGRPDLVGWIDAVLRGQADLDARRAEAWAAWSPGLRLETLRLMRWRELTGERPVGEAARCHAAMARDAGPALTGPPPGGTRRHDTLPLLAGSRPLPATIEAMLLGWGVPAVREPADTVIACLVAALRLRGHLLRFTDLQAEWPVPNTGLTLADWQRLSRRVGLQAVPAPPHAPPAPGRPTLCALRDGSCLLLLDEARVYAPGVSPPFRHLRPGAMPAPDVAFLAVLAGAGSPERLLRRPVRPLRLDTLRGHAHPGALADAARLRDLQPAASRWPDVSPDPPRLDGLTLPDLLAAHRRLGPAGSPFHGHFRRVDLHTTTAFLAWPQIPAAMDALVVQLARRPPAGDALSHARALAGVFMDFLRIHPFLNGNRRVAMALASVWARREGQGLDWTRLSRVQLHHAVRCAAAGHPRTLVQALAACLQPGAADVG